MGDIQRIYNGPYGGTLVTPPLVKTLLEAYTRMVGEDNFKNSRIATKAGQVCLSVLKQLESELLPKASGKPN